MRTKLIGILRQAAQRSEKFNDYNFRVYFVNKFNKQADKVEANAEIKINEDDIANALRFYFETLTIKIFILLIL